LLPGSRAEEVENVLPTLLETARRLGAETHYVVSAAANIGTDRIRTLVESSLAKESQRLKIAILREDLYDALKHSAAAVVCSGTATLETALIGTPFVMVYRIARWRWALRGFFVRVPYYCIVNLIAGRQVVTELMQDEFTPQRTAEEIRRLLGDGAERAGMAREFAGLRDLLDRGDALGSAAHSIVELLSSLRIT
jgi:lipid-A-disaccharide synthase